MAKVEYDAESYLEWRRQQNKSITTLTPRQHDALEFLANARHEMHKDLKSFILSDNEKHSQFEQYIGPNGAGTLNHALAEAGLPTIDFPKAIYKVLLEDAVKRSDFNSDYEYQLEMAKNLDKDKEITEHLNAVIEKYLRDIDEKHHTQYCPKANHRISRDQNYTQKVLSKIERQTAMMDEGSRAYAPNHNDVITKSSTAYAERPQGSKQRLFIDMDGVLTVFDAVNSLEELFEPGYFSKLQPQPNIIEAVKELVKRAETEDIDVFIITSIINGSKTAQQEKDNWLNQYLPEVDQKHRIYCKSGIDRTTAVPGGLRKDDFLLDDYTKNLQQWEPPARAVKFLNGINHTNSSWQGDRLRCDRDGIDLADRLTGLMHNEEHVFDTNKELVGKVTKVIRRQNIDTARNARMIYGYDSYTSKTR